MKLGTFARAQAWSNAIQNFPTASGRLWIWLGAQLGISPRTVEHYRESAMARMQATKFAELVQMRYVSKRKG